MKSPDSKITTLKSNLPSKGESTKLTKRELHKRKGHKIKLNHKYDAYYCVTCVEWLERKCIQESCQFCPDRPEKPTV